MTFRPLFPLVAPALFFVSLLDGALTASPVHAGVPAGGAMVQAANVWLGTLAPEQKARALKPWEDAGRVGWHFIPKFERKGLPLREMVPSQQQGAFDLLRAADTPSRAGFKSWPALAIGPDVRIRQQIFQGQQDGRSLFDGPCSTGLRCLRDAALVGGLPKIEQKIIVPTKFDRKKSRLNEVAMERGSHGRVLRERCAAARQYRCHAVKRGIVRA